MRWRGGRKSSNVEDRRGQSTGFRSAAAAPMVMRILPSLIKTKVGRTILIVGVVVIFGSKMLGIDILPLLLGGAGGGAAVSGDSSEHECGAARIGGVCLGCSG